MRQLQKIVLEKLSRAKITTLTNKSPCFVVFVSRFKRKVVNKFSALAFVISEILPIFAHPF